MKPTSPKKQKVLVTTVATRTVKADMYLVFAGLIHVLDEQKKGVGVGGVMAGGWVVREGRQGRVGGFFFC